ncbi:MAG: hypothetical protein K2X63_04330, partial [Burkholderiaceae bacterium]|nr:hypothetical protein [Burkholderiaceae bacterium]
MTTAIQITPAPTPTPSRDDPDNFPSAANNRLTWEDVHLVPEMNAALVQTNANAIIAAMGKDAATVALAAANFKGLYSSLTGGLNVPASAYHLGAYWMLMSNLANVTTKVPGTDPEWKPLSTVNALPTFKASGAITAGDTVAINADG